MLNFAQCVIKPQFVVGFHGANEYHEAFQSILQQSYNIPFRIINIENDSMSIDTLSSASALIPKDQPNKPKGKITGIISRNFFNKIKSIPFAIFICFKISESNLLDNNFVTLICKTIEQVQIKNPKKSLIVLLLSKNLIQKDSDTSSFIRSIRSRIILDKKFVLHIKEDISNEANSEKIKSKLLELELNKIAFNFYKTKKQAYDNLWKQNDLPQETLAKVAIKQAYIALLFQNEKLASAYYKETYEIVMNKLLKPNDSINNKRLFFIEQRNASDWLLVNMFETLKMDNETKKLALMNHLNQFDYELYFGKGINDKKNTEVDHIIIAMSYYWKICFDDYFSNLLDNEDLKEMKSFIIINSIKRLITYITNKNDILINTPIDITIITEKDSIFIEKIPSYYSTVAVDGSCNQIVFDSDMILKIFFRKFIEKFNMTSKGLASQLLTKANKLFQLKDQWTNCQFCLKALASTCELEDKDKEPLYSSLINNPNIELYSIVYVDVLEKYNEILLRMTPLNVNQIIFNLIKISEYRDLTEFEYKTIKNILSETMTSMQSLIFQVNSVNRLIQPSYTFSNYSPSICQLITFTLTINLNIDDFIKFKVKSIILQFNHLPRTKKIMYTEAESPVFSKNLPLVISYELFIQPLDSNLFLSNVQLETQNGMIFLISIKEEVTKSLKTITEQDLKTHVSLNYPLKYIVGLREYHLFNFRIEKKNDAITFDEVDAVFYFNDMNTIVPSHVFIRCIDGINTEFKNKLQISNKQPGDIKGIDFLMKLSSKLKEEPYKLSFEIKIKISHMGLNSDYFLYEEKGIVLIHVKDAFQCSHDVVSSFMMKDDTMITYPANRRIKNYITIRNNLGYPMSIKEIKFIPSTESIKLHSEYNNYFKRIMTCLLPLSEFIFPIYIQSDIETSTIGKIAIHWESLKLKTYNSESSLVNVDIFDLPCIEIKNFDVYVDVDIDANGMMKVRLDNKTEFPCQTLLTVGKNENKTDDKDEGEGDGACNIVSGKTIDKIMLSPYSVIESKFDLIMSINNLAYEQPPIVVKIFKFGKIQKAQKELYSLIVNNNE